MMISNQYIPASAPVTSPLVDRADARERQTTTDTSQRKTNAQSNVNYGEYFPAIPDQESLARLAESGSYQNGRQQSGPSSAYEQVEIASKSERIGSLINLFV